MGLRLQRALGPLDSIESGQYAVDAPCVFVCCPKCAGIDDISTTHEVSVGGVVTPRWTCKTVTCGFRDFVSLDCWNEEPHR